MSAFPMRWPIAMVLCSGCIGFPTQEQAEPGSPKVIVGSSWIQGEPTEACVYWTYSCWGTGDWFCPSTTITVQHVACQGCSVTDDLAGQPFRITAPIVATATTDGPITITATLRFDDTGQIQQVSGRTGGDHEVALEATCRVIDSATLAARDLRAVFPASLFRPCSARRATDTVVVFPAIRTAGGAARFPFCFSDAPCTNGDGARLRPQSALAITPAPTGWGRTDEREPAEFVVLPPLGAATAVPISAPLAGGGISTTSVAIPPAQ